MITLPKPQVIITHESDLDGLVAGCLLQRLARKMFNIDVPLEAYHYHAWKQRDMREAHAWVTDLAFDERMDRLGWCVFDHHVTELQPRQAKLFLDSSKSAGSICYDLCKEAGLGTPELDQLVHFNNIADLFLDDDPAFAEASDYASLVKVYQFWNLHRLIGGQIEKLLNHPLLEVMRTKRRIEDPIGFEWSRYNIQKLSDNVGYVETVVGNTNLVVNRLLEEKATPYPVLVTIFRRAATVTVASFRSQNGEAIKIAERFKGGGHPNAAGAMLPRSIKNIQQGLDYIRKVLTIEADITGETWDLEQAFEDMR